MSFKAIIEADIKLFNQNIDKAIVEMDRLEKSTTRNLSKIGDSFINIGKKASILSAGLVAVGAKSFLMAADFEDAIGATEQIFKDSADAVSSWAEGLDTSFGIAKKEALEYSNLMGSMLINIGNLTEREASRQSAKLIELAGDLTAMYGGTTQDAVRALTGALKGNNTMLDNYGMAVNEALIKDKALEMGLIGTTGEMSLQAKQAATLALIWEQTGASQGQAAREADGASGAMRALKTEIVNLSTELGEVLLPIITPMIGKLRDMVAGFRGMSPELQKAIVTVGAVTAAIGPLLVVTGKILKTLPLIKVAFTALTGPIGLTVAAIAGAVTLIIANWDKIKEYFTSGEGAGIFNTVKEMATVLKNDLKKVFEDIKKAVMYVWDAMGSDIIKVIRNSVSTITTVVEVLVKTFRNVVQVLDGIFRLDFKDALNGLTNLFTDIFEGIGKIAANALSSISSALAGFFDLIGVDKWAEGLRSFSEKMKPAVSAVTEEIAKISETSEETTSTIKDLGDAGTEAFDSLAKGVDGVASAFKDGSNIYEVIRRTSDEIYNLNERLKGLRDGTIVVSSVRKEIEETENKVKELNTALDLLTGGRDLNINLKLQSGAELLAGSSLMQDLSPVITPKIDTSLIEVGMGDVSAMLQDSIIDLTSVVSSGITSFAQSIGNAFGSGNFENIGGELIAGLGQLAQQFGSMLIGFGVAALHLQTLIANPFTAIAAGAALVALGAAASAAASSMMKNATGGGYSSTSSMANSSPSYGHSDYRGAYQDDFTVTFVQKGGDLVGVLDTAEQRRRRT